MSISKAASARLESRIQNWAKAIAMTSKYTDTGQLIDITNLAGAFNVSLMMVDKQRLERRSGVYIGQYYLDLLNRALKPHHVQVEYVPSPEGLRGRQAFKLSKNQLRGTH